MVGHTRGEQVLFMNFQASGKRQVKETMSSAENAHNATIATSTQLNRRWIRTGVSDCRSSAIEILTRHRFAMYRMPEAYAAYRLYVGSSNLDMLERFTPFGIVLIAQSTEQQRAFPDRLPSQYKQRWTGPRYRAVWFFRKDIVEAGTSYKSYTDQNVGTVEPATNGYLC